MQVEAIYHHGRLEFSHPMQFKHDYVRLVVDVPEDEIVNTCSMPQELLGQAREMLAKLDAIRNAPLTLDNELPELTTKQLERIEAFELRAQMRTEQGRPD